MARHRLAGVWPLVRRSRYVALRRRYLELERDYRVLAGELDARLADTVETPLPRVRRVPSWAVTEDGLDPAKAGALVRRKGLLVDPAGSWP